MPWSPRIRRGLRRLTLVVVLLLALVTVPLIALQFAQVRQIVLHELLKRADAALPGRIVAGEAAWPGLGHLLLQEVTWTLDGETLARVPLLELRWDVGELVQRRLHVPLLHVQVAFLDVPRLQRALQQQAATDSAASSEKKTTGKASVPWLRDGGVRGLPSIRVEDLRLDAEDCRLGDTTRVASLALGAQVDLRADRLPRLVIAPLRLQMQGPALEILDGDVQVDPDAGVVQCAVQSSDGSAWTLAIHTTTSETDVVHMQVMVGPRSVDPIPLVTARVDLRRDGSRVDGMQVEAEIVVPPMTTLRTLPLLGSQLAGAPDLEGPAIRVAGTVRWRPRWETDLSTTWHPNAWIEAGAGRFVQRGDTLRVESAALQLHDLRVEGTWQKIAGIQDGDVRLQVAGTRWMQDVAPDVTPPDSLAVTAQATVHQEGADPSWTVTLRAAASQGPTTLQDLLCRMRSDGSPTDLLFDVQARAQGWDATVAGAASLGDSVQVLLAPLRVAEATAQSLQPRREALQRPATPASVVWHPERGVHADALRVEGDLGSLRVDARWRPDQQGNADVHLAWPEPPAVLLRRIAPDSLRQRLRHDWPTADQPGVRITARSTPRDAGVEVQATTTLVLPGPRTFAFALPESVQVDDLDALRGTLVADAVFDSLSPRWRAFLDLNETSWLDSTQVSLQARNDSVFVDSLRVLWDGLDVRLTGAADTTDVRLQGRLAWDATRWVARVPAARDAELDVTADAAWSVTGRATAPDADITLGAQVTALWGGVPHLDATLTVRDGVVHEARVSADEGIRANTLEWDRMLFTLQPSRGASDSLSRVRFDLLGPQQELHAALRLDLPQARSILTDTLQVRLFDRDLASTRPFAVQRSDSGVVLEDLQLRGSLGTIEAAAVVTADTLGLRAEADLQLPEQPDFLRVPAGLWPTTVRLRAVAAGNDSFSVSLSTQGLQLADRSEVAVVANVRADQDSTRFSIDIVDPADTLLTSRGSLPLRWTLRPTAFALQQDSLFLDAAFVDFPIPDVFEDPRTAVDYLDRSRSSGGSQMNGELHVDGQLQSPRAYGFLQLQPEDPTLADYRAHVFLALQQEESTWGRDLQQQLDRLSTRDILRPPGAKLAIWVVRDTARVLDAACHVPVNVGYRDGKLQIESSAELHAALRSATLQLKDFNPMLPPRTSLDGILKIDLRADGAWKDPRLQGGLRFTDLALGMPDGSRVRASGEVDVQGPASDPGVTGKVRVRDGLIRIPEIPRSLLPTQGDALLLAGTSVSVDSLLGPPEARDASDAPPDADTGAAPTVSDSTSGPASNGASGSRSRRRRPTPQLPQKETNVFLEIPGAFWIRGRGFEVELSGNLQLTVREGHMRVLGELKAERGDLKLLASKFPIKTGRVIFYGDDETNPSLDLVMGRKYDDVLVEVVVQGTAKEPEIEFRSDPQLSEDEILSYVLFGRGTQKLDETQTSQFDERALALASLLTTNLGEGLREQTGVDLISLEQSAETADRASLVVGKYLSPRVLLKYVQDLEKGRGYAVNVEYWLRGGLRLLTTSSRFQQSGLELNWSHEY